MKKRKRNLTAEQRAAIGEALADVRAELGAIRGVFEVRLERMAAWEAAEARRKQRLRKLTFGVLGRA
jgi:hypothetical protein